MSPRKGRSLEEFDETFNPLTRTQQDLERAQRRAAELEKKIKKDGPIARLYALMEERPAAPPKWLYTPPKKGAKSPVIATSFLSDTHLDEVVTPQEINGVNEYNRAIAERRIKHFADKTILMCARYLNFDVQGLVCPFGGDMVGGIIHEELKETNEAPLLATALHWTDRLEAMLLELGKYFRFVHVPAVPGNHGRLSRKPRMKGRCEDNVDWLIYKLLEQRFKARGNSNVTFQVGVDPDVRWKVYAHKYLMTHGDQFTGGTGWGGMASPIMRGDDKKRKREQAVQLPYDTMLMGHWHTLNDYGRVLINGSTKGYDEYAYLNNFGYEVPQQAFWLTDAKHGRMLSCPIFVADGETFAEPRMEVAL